MISKNCNLCKSSALDAIIDLGYHPCADTFISNFDNNHGSETRFPLKVCLCQDCGHAQLSYVVPGPERYQDTDYSYDSSNSIVSVEHFQRMAVEVSRQVALQTTDLVCDIGSNIGTLLEFFRESSGCKIIGVDPSTNISELANKNGVLTINNFFNTSSFKGVMKLGRPKLLTSTNALNHSEDVINFFKLASELIVDDGYIVIEVPYLLELVKQRAFDTIYLEHINYFSVGPLATYLLSIGLCIKKVEVREYMCGSLRLYIKKGNHHDPEVDVFIKEEIDYGLRDVSIYSDFMKNLKQLKTDLNKRLYDIKAGGGIIFGIGAATKGNTLLNFCNVDSDLIDFISDSSSLKVGKYTPGSHIKIIHDKDIPKEVTHGLILPWNIAEYLENKLEYLNISFITPILENKNEDKM